MSRPHSQQTQEVLESFTQYILTVAAKGKMIFCPTHNFLCKLECISIVHCCAGYQKIDYFCHEFGIGNEVLRFLRLLYRFLRFIDDFGGHANLFTDISYSVHSLSAICHLLLVFQHLLNAAQEQAVNTPLQGCTVNPK